MSQAAVDQTPLLDLDGASLNPFWVNKDQPLFIPTHPVHFMAHKLQVLLERLDKQAEKNPAQFNSTTYLAILKEYTRCCEAIKDNREILDERGVDQGGNDSSERAVGSTVALGVDSGIPTDNPLAR